MPRTGYRGVATVAFVHVPGGGPPRFLEVYPRLPPEHALIEETTGVDLVRLQLHVGAGRPSRRRATGAARRRLAGPAQRRGPRAGVRAGAGSSWPACGSAPGRACGSTPPSPRATSSSPAARCSWPRSLAWAPSRDEARVRLRRALDETTVVIDGGSTNKGFLLDVLDRPEVREARVDNAFVDRIAAQGEIAVERDADLALLVAAIDAYETERDVDQARFFASAHRGRPRTAPEVGPHGRAPLTAATATGCTSTASARTPTPSSSTGRRR